MKKEQTNPSTNGASEKVAPQDCLLLLPHCLRKVERCQATYDSHGLQCAHCTACCAISQLTRVAEELGYGGICVAPGGSLAAQAVAEMLPRVIVAVACDKELKMGIETVAGMSNNGDDYNPRVEVIPLVKDGCVNTEVDVAAALLKIRHVISE